MMLNSGLLVVIFLLGGAQCDTVTDPTQFGLRSIVLNSRIVGGFPTTIEEFPWTVTMQRLGAHRCGAAIIAANRILTAAHCVAGIPSNSLSIRAGSTYSQVGGQLIKVHHMISHPGYKTKTFENDITVMWLASWLNVSPAGVSVVPMPSYMQAVTSGTQAYVSGWGFLEENGNANAISLRAVALPIVEQTQCKALVSGINDGMICAGYPEGGRDACQNDSGGPLTVNGSLVGIVSWGVGCARQNKPGVYTRVAYYRSWIDQNM